MSWTHASTSDQRTYAESDRVSVSSMYFDFSTTELEHTTIRSLARQRQALAGFLRDDALMRQPPTMITTITMIWITMSMLMVLSLVLFFCLCFDVLDTELEREKGGYATGLTSCVFIMVETEERVIMLPSYRSLG
jgi:hypothetical protein